MRKAFPDAPLLQRVEILRGELADLAFRLETQGRCDAADVANLLRERLAEISAPEASAAVPTCRGPANFP